MFFKIRRAITNGWFDFCCRDIFKTPPLRINKKSPLVLVSMVCHNDLAKYLIAIKSLYFYLEQGEIIIINDGSLDHQDRKTLEHHVRPAQILEISSIKNKNLPQGGTWERLSTIAGFVKDRYVIQVDSDTVTIADVPEVKDCIRDNRSFVVGTYRSHEIISMKTWHEALVKLLSGPWKGVKMVWEFNFSKLQNFLTLKYINGSSAFAGFAKGSTSLQAVEHFSHQMEKIVGSSEWSKWGSEQITSNYIIANTPNAYVLPWPRYANYQPPPSNINIPFDKSAFLHFFGTCRFQKGLYINNAESIIRKLKNLS